MAVTVAQVKDCLAEFAAVSDTKVQKWLDMAERRINTTHWGTLADDAG